MTRPLKITRYEAARLCKLIADGQTLAQAARDIGCTVRTIRNTAARDADFRELLEAAKRKSPRYQLARRKRNKRSATLFEGMLDHCRSVFIRKQNEKYRKLGILLKAMLGYRNFDEFAPRPKRRGRPRKARMIDDQLPNHYQDD